MSISQDPLETARQALEPGETLVWADRPDPEILARSKLPQVIRGAMGLAVIAGLLWFVFLPQWPAGNMGMLLGVFMAGSVLYCLWLLAAPVVAKAAAGRTVYAVTDRRVLILQSWPLPRRRAFVPSDLEDPAVSSVAPGLGTIVFINRKLPWWERRAGGSYQMEAFFGVADAQVIAEEIAKLKAGASPDGLPDEET